MCGKNKLIVPVLLSGGNGERLRPLVDDELPKSLLTLFSDKPLLVETAKRFLHPAFTSPIITCSRKHFEKTCKCLHEFELDYSRILIEPYTRDTCMAIASVVAYASQMHPDLQLLITPIDHYIPDFTPFLAAILERAGDNDGTVLTFGISATGPDPSYGYIKPESQNTRHPCQILGFEEKPALDWQSAETPNGYLWNSGLFYGTTRTLADELERHCPDALRIASQSLPCDCSATKHVELESQHWSRAKFGSFDLEVMQKTQNARVIQVDTQWQDLGNWHTISKIAASSTKALTASGNIKIECLDGNLLVTKNAEITLQGMDNVVAVANGNKVYIAPNHPIIGKKQTSCSLISDKPPQARQFVDPSVSHKPWGQYKVLEEGPGYLTKRLEVTPNASTSLQFHQHRSEHWVVIGGEACVTVGEKQRQLCVGQSIFVKAGQIHRIKNQTKNPLLLIETQIGNLCDENDIVRLKDEYGRT